MRNLKLIGLLAMLAAALSATTVSGAFKDPSLAVGGGRACFTLVVPGDRTATRLSTPQQIVPTTLCYTLDGNGNLPSGVFLVGNDDLSPNTTYYKVQISTTNGSVVGTQYVYIQGDTEDLGTAMLVSPVPGTPAFTLSDLPGPMGVVSSSSGSTPFTVTGASGQSVPYMTIADASGNVIWQLTATGEMIASNFDNVLHADQFAGGDAALKIHNCLLALPTTGGICDARGFTGSQTVSSNPFDGITTPFIVILGHATFVTSVGWEISGNDQILTGVGGDGYPGGSGASTRGAVIEAAASFPVNTPLLTLDPLGNSSSSMSGSFVADLAFNMANVPQNVALQINSVVTSLDPFHGLVFVNSDGVKIGIGRSTQSSAVAPSSLQFQQIYSYGYNSNPTYGALQSAGIKIDGGAKNIVFRDGSLTLNTSGLPDMNAIGALVEGNADNIVFDNLYFTGFGIGVRLIADLNFSVIADNGAPHDCRINNVYFEDYALGVDIEGSAAATAENNTVSNPSFESPENVTTPGNVTVQMEGSGSVTNGCYRVAAVDNFGGVSAASPEVCGSGANANGVINWGVVPGAVGYYIYGRTSDGEGQLGTELDNNSYTDTGSTSVGAGPPEQSTSASIGVKFGDYTKYNRATMGDFLSTGLAGAFTKNASSNTLHLMHPVTTDGNSGGNFTDLGSNDGIFGLANGGQGIMFNRLTLGGTTDTTNYAAVIGSHWPNELPAIKWQNAQSSPSFEVACGFISSPNEWECRNVTTNTTLFDVQAGSDVPDFPNGYTTNGGTTGGGGTGGGGTGGGGTGGGGTASVLTSIAGVWSGYNVGSMTTVNQVFAEWTPPQAIDIDAVYWDSSSGSNCTTNPVLSIYDSTTGTELIDSTIGAQAGWNNSKTVMVPAGDQLQMKVITAENNCTQLYNDTQISVAYHPDSSVTGKLELPSPATLDPLDQVAALDLPAMPEVVAPVSPQFDYDSEPNYPTFVPARYDVPTPKAVAGSTALGGMFYTSTGTITGAEGTWSGWWPGDLANGYNHVLAQWQPRQIVDFDQLTYTEQTTVSGCTTNGTLSLVDATTGTILKSVDVTGWTNDVSFAPIQSISGHLYEMKVTQAASCNGGINDPTNVNFTVSYHVDGSVNLGTQAYQGIWTGITEFLTSVHDGPGLWKPDNAITINALYFTPLSAPAGCTTNAVVSLWDTTQGTTIATYSVTNSGEVVNLPSPVQVNALDGLEMKVTTAAAGCTTTPYNLEWGIGYTMTN